MGLQYALLVAGSVALIAALVPVLTALANVGIH